MSNLKSFEKVKGIVDSLNVGEKIIVISEEYSNGAFLTNIAKVMVGNDFKGLKDDEIHLILKNREDDLKLFTNHKDGTDKFSIVNSFNVDPQTLAKAISNDVNNGNVMKIVLHSYRGTSALFNQKDKMHWLDFLNTMRWVNGVDIVDIRTEGE